MATRTIKVFSAGCSICDKTIEMIRDIACSSCKITVLDMNEGNVAQRAESFGITTVPAVVIDGELVECCEGAGPDEVTLRNAGVGQVA